MVSNVVMTCFRVLQKVNTRLSARCVFSSVWKDAGHGIVLVTGFVKEEPFRASAGGCFDFWTRRGFAPPSWLLVGTLEVVEVVAWVSDPEASSGVATSSASFRLRLRTILLETVAAFNPAIVVAMASTLTDFGSPSKLEDGVDDIDWDGA